MKKLFLAALLGFSLTTLAQSPAFEVGDNVINVGIGFGGFYSGSITSLPLSISFEHGIIEDFLVEGSYLGVGGFLGYAQSKQEFIYSGGTFGWKYTYLNIGARANWHYTFVDNLDTYFGLTLGYNSISSEPLNTNTIPVGNSPTSGGIYLGGHIGGRYYFTDNIAAMLELGWGTSFANLGVAFKF